MKKNKINLSYKNLGFRNTYKNILYLFIVLIMVTLTDSVYAKAFPFVGKFVLLIFASVFGIAFLMRALTKQAKIPVIKLLFLLWMILLLICTGLIHGDLTNGQYITLILVLLSGFFISSLLPMDIFVVNFKSIIMLIAIFSLIGFVATPFIISHTYLSFPLITSTNGTPYINLFVYFQFAFNLFRNTGIFWEPGVYQAYLSIGLMMYLYYSDKITFWAVVILVITIITTFSTIGYLSTILIMLSIFLSDKLTNKQKKNLGIIAVLTTIVILFFGFSSEFKETTGYFSVLGKAIYKSSSFYERWNSFIAGFNVAIKKPLFGVGLSFAYNAAFFEGCSIFCPFINFTNTLSYWVCACGLGVGIPLIYAWYKFCGLFSKNRCQVAILFIAFLLIMFNENFYQSFLFDTLLFYGLNSLKRNERSV